MTIRKMFGYVRNNIRAYGTEATLHELACRLINKAIDFQIMKAMTVRPQDVRDRSLFESPGFEARFVPEDQLWRLALEPEHQISPEFLKAALARGDRCYALFDGERLAAYGWYSDVSTPLNEHFLMHFDSAWAYMYKGYTMPAYRGKRLHAVGMCQALRALAAAGKRGLIGCVASTNLASLQSCERMGWRIFGDIWLLRGLGRSAALATRSCGQHRFRAEPRAPELDLVVAADFRKQ